MVIKLRESASFLVTKLQEFPSSWYSQTCQYFLFLRSENDFDEK